MTASLDLLDAHAFAARVHKGDTCWNWTGTVTAKGYGVLSVLQPTGRRMNVYAHRIAYYLAHGELPGGGMVIDHTCNNRRCVNPAHLDACTIVENIRRGVERGSHRGGRTHCPQGHPYSGDNLYVAPGTGWRSCRACMKARAA